MTVQFEAPTSWRTSSCLLFLLLRPSKRWQTSSLPLWLLTDTRRLRIPSLLAPSLLASAHVPTTGAAAAHAHLDQPCQDRSGSSDPHEREHLNANIGFDVELGRRRNSFLHDDEHDRGDDGGDGCAEGAEEGENGDGKRGPAGEDGKWDDEHEDEVQRRGGQEEAEHPVGDNANEGQDFVDLGG